MLTNLTRKALLASVVILPMASVSAFAEPVFTVNETSIPGTTLGNPSLQASRITFSYTAVINQTQPVNQAGGNAAFTESGFFNKNTFLLNGAVAPSLLNAPTTLGGQGYGLYGIFNISGVANPDGSGGITATFNTMTLTLYADPNQDTTLGFGPPTANGLNLTAQVTGGGTDDYALMIETLSVGRANVRGALNNGDFDAVLNTRLTNATDTGSALQNGETFFTSPRPFYVLEDFAGNTTDLTPPGSGTAPFTSTATGAGTETFLTSPTRTPEPASLAVLGAGLIGLGALRRRRKSS